MRYVDFEAPSVSAIPYISPRFLSFVAPLLRGQADPRLGLRTLRASGRHAMLGERRDGCAKSGIALTNRYKMIV